MIEIVSTHGRLRFKDDDAVKAEKLYREYFSIDPTAPLAASVRNIQPDGTQSALRPLKSETEKSHASSRPVDEKPDAIPESSSAGNVSA